MDTFCSEDIKELAGAMLKVQSDINPAIKDATNPFAKSRYATLNSVINASREAQLTHGVSGCPESGSCRARPSGFDYEAHTRIQRSMAIIPVGHASVQG
jgi:hypothetical protein